MFRWLSQWRAYLRQSLSRTKHRNPHSTTSFRALFRNTAVSCSLYALGDMFEQRVEGYGEGGTTDWSRTGRMAVMGAFIGSIDTYWYTKLDKMVPGSDGRSVTKKVFLDQIIWSPVCCSTYFFGMSLMEGNPTRQCFNEVRAKFWPTYKVDWMVWPPAQAINFLFTPPKYRVICVAFITFMWTIFLSYMKHKKMVGEGRVLKPS